MSNWFTRILFFLFAIIVFYFVSFFAESSKVIDFIRDQEDTFLTNDLHLIQTTAIANYHDGTDAYVYKNPLFSEHFISADSKFEINFRTYTFVTFKNTEAFHSIAFIANDIKIGDALTELDNKERPIIDVKITFTEPLVFNEQSYITSTETLAFVLDTNTAMFIINHDVLKSNDTFTEIKQMDFYYRLSESQSTLLLSLRNENEETMLFVDKFDESFDRNLSELTNENIQILSKINFENLEAHEDIYFDNTLMKQFNRYNKYYFIYLSITFVILGTLAYFFFFHKHIMIKYKGNKKMKQEQLDKFVQELANKNKGA